MKSVMFVCTGNICRSAMAHHYMQKRLYDLNKEKEIIVSSCGTSALDGERSTSNAISVMKNYNVDLSVHRATDIFNINIEDYDLILCMTEQHKFNVLAYFPNLKEKVFTLKEYVFKGKCKNIDIDDPWGYNIKIYNACAKEIVECVDKLLLEL